MANCRTYVEGPYSIFIGSALRARQFAESQTDSPALQRKRNQQREQQERSDLLELADKMEEVVRHYQSCRKAQHPQRVPSPTGLPLPELPQEAEAKRSLEWLGREAHRLRQVAEKVSAGEPMTGHSRPRQPAEWWKGKTQSVARAGCVHAADGQLHVPMVWSSLATMSLPRSRTLHFRMQTWSRKMSVRPAGRRRGQPGGSGALNQ